MEQFENRALGAYEKLFWIIGQNHPLQFVMVAEIEGKAALTDWAAALLAIQNRHLLFSAAVVNGEDDISRYRFLKQTPIPFRLEPAGSVTSWEKEAEKELVTPFDDPDLPLLRAVLFEADTKSALMLVVHHTIGDGISLSYVFRDLLQALNGGQLENLPMPSSIDELSGLTNAEPESTGAVPGVKPAATQAKPKREFKTPVVTRLRVSPELTDQLQRRAKVEGTTVHGALYAGLIKAGKDISAKWESQPVRILTSASTRDVLRSGESASLFINSRLISFDEEKQLPFWDLARFAKKSLEGITSLDNIRGATTGLRKAVFNAPGAGDTYSFLKNDRAQELLLTNLGRLSYNSGFGNFQLSALWGPAIAPRNKGEQVIGVITFNGTMLLTQTSFEPLPGYLEKTIEVIKAVC